MLFVFGYWFVVYCLCFDLVGFVLGFSGLWFADAFWFVPGLCSMWAFGG